MPCSLAISAMAAKSTHFSNGLDGVSNQISFVSGVIDARNRSKSDISICVNFMPACLDLMRLNKSFVVKRSEKTKRTMLNASKNLSAYIHHSLTENNQNIMNK